MDENSDWWKYYFHQELKLTLMTMIKVFLGSLYKTLAGDPFLSILVNIWWHSNCKMGIWYAVKILFHCPTLLNPFCRKMVHFLVKISIFQKFKIWKVGLSWFIRIYSWPSLSTLDTWHLMYLKFSHTGKWVSLQEEFRACAVIGIRDPSGVARRSVTRSGNQSALKGEVWSGGTI